MKVLTFTVNDHNQYGEYFLKAWVKDPSEEELIKGILLEDKGRSLTEAKRIAKELINKKGKSVEDMPYSNYITFYLKTQK